MPERAGTAEVQSIYSRHNFYELHAANNARGGNLQSLIKTATNRTDNVCGAYHRARVAGGFITGFLGRGLQPQA